MRDVKHYSHADQSNNNNKRGGKKKNYNQTKWKTPLKKTKQVYRVPHTNKFVLFFLFFKFSSFPAEDFGTLLQIDTGYHSFIFRQGKAAISLVGKRAP